jgi:hypothetical protein
MPRDEKDLRPAFFELGKMKKQTTIKGYTIGSLNKYALDFAK